MESELSNTRSPLDVENIVESAMALADEVGVEAVTMRKIADRLGFKVMALYNHISSKDELLGLLVDAVAAEIEAPKPGAEAMATVRELAVRFREALVRHAWASALWNRHMPGPARTAQMESLLRTLAATGLRADLAHHGFHAVNNHVLGYTLQEQAMTLDTDFGADPDEVARGFIAGLSGHEFLHTIAHVRQHLEGETESSFDLVLDLILDGLVELNARG